MTSPFNATDCVLDLETMGNRSHAPVLSIGAVLINRHTGAFGPEFHAHLPLAEAIQFGGQPDGSTLLWWLEQSEAARASLLAGQQRAGATASALVRFADFLGVDEDTGVNKDILMWGNGATFDCVLLRNTFERHGLVCPWAFWGDRDLRTAVDMAGLDKKTVAKPEGFVAHDALWDAKYQAAILLAALDRVDTKRRAVGLAEAAATKVLGVDGRSKIAYRDHQFELVDSAGAVVARVAEPASVPGDDQQVDPYAVLAAACSEVAPTSEDRPTRCDAGLSAGYGSNDSSSSCGSSSSSDNGSSW